MATDYLRRRLTQGGHLAHMTEAPADAWRYGKGAPIGPAVGGQAMPSELCVKPINWWLGTLPPTRVSKVNRVFRAAFDNTVQETQLASFSLEDGVTLVLFAHHFFATTPGAGDITDLVPPWDFHGLVEPLFRVDGKSPYTVALDDGGTARSGQPLLTNDPFGHREDIPLFINGSATLDFSYNVLAAPGFTVNHIAFVMKGFAIATSDLESIRAECT